MQLTQALTLKEMIRNTKTDFPFIVCTIIVFFKKKKKLEMMHEVSEAKNSPNKPLTCYYYSILIKTSHQLYI